MQWTLTRLVALVLFLALGTCTTAAAEQSSREELPSLNTPSQSSISNDAFGSPSLIQTSPTTVDNTDLEEIICSTIFASIGPFCQNVVPDTDSGICQPGFSMDTCNNCQVIVQLCGFLDQGLESICLSGLAQFCVAPQFDSFIMDYCSVVQSVCTGQSASGDLSSSGSGSAVGSGGSGLSGSGVLSGSGSGSGSGGSGLSGSGSGSGDGSGVVEPTVIPTTGSPGPTTTAAPTTTAPTTTAPTTTAPTTAAPTTTISTTTISTTTIDITTINTTTVTVPPFTTPFPTVLVTVEDLTEQQRENIVTVGFAGLSEEQFLDNGITVFREEIAAMVNDLLLNQGQNRKKRQVPPAQVSPDDVIIIEPLRMVNGELLVSFVVGGQGGQSAPVSGTDVANLLEEEGPSLAMVLSNVTGQTVQFVEALSTTVTITEPTTTTSEPSTTPDLPTTSALPTIEEPEQLEQLSSGAIAGIVIAVLVVALVLAAVVVAIVALVLSSRRSGRIKFNLKTTPQSLPQLYTQESTQDETHSSSDCQPVMAMTIKNEYVDVPTTADRVSTTEGNSDTEENTQL